MEALPLEEEIQPLTLDVGTAAELAESLAKRPPRLRITIRLRPFSKYATMPGSELYGSVIEVGKGKFKVVGLADVMAPGRNVTHRELTLAQQP